MNTNWEEQFDKTDWMNFGGDQWCGCSFNEKELKTFIKDQITKAQKEIAEQIIEDIPGEFPEPVHLFQQDIDCLKSKLRKKYIKKDE